MQKALEKYNEALPIRREVGDRNGEAATLLGIAQVEQNAAISTSLANLLNRQSVWSNPSAQISPARSFALPILPTGRSSLKLTLTC